ncbi:protein-glutamine gamma-glutamyltransferase TgpA [soil metagenome]
MTVTLATRWQSRIRGLGTDARQLLLLMIAVGCILLPHVENLPVWCAAVALVAFVTKIALVIGRRAAPPSWVLAVVVTLIVAATWLNFRTLIGRDAGVALLAMLICVKLLELRARRDTMVVICLGFFLAICEFLYSQAISAAFFVLLATLALLTALVAQQLEGDPAVDPPPSFKRAFGMSLGLVTLSAPLVAVLFVLFPRLPGPLWGTPDSGGAGTGLSDTMAPGSVTRLAESDAIAFRVRFAITEPPTSVLYWRALVLNDYDGRTWRERRRLFAQQGPETAIEAVGNPVDYTIAQEALGRPWLYVLEAPLSRPAYVDGDTTRGVALSGPLTFSSERAIRERVTYTGRSGTRARFRPAESSASLNDQTALPPGRDPRTHALGQQLRDRNAGDTAAIVTAALARYREQGFRYTLEPPPLGADAVDEFLFDTRAGFCEHFASSFVVLMRAAGVPARVVTGYQGGERNPFDGWYEVRQRDAHAWTEVWYGQERGWVRVDPTAAVAPDRVDLGARNALPAPAGITGFVLGPSSPLTLGARWLRNRWDAIENDWNQWIVQYNTDAQRGLLDRLGLGDFDWHHLVLAIVIIVTGSSLGMTAVVLWRREPRDPLLLRFARFEAKLARAGLAR